MSLKTFSTLSNVEFTNKSASQLHASKIGFGGMFFPTFGGDPGSLIPPTLKQMEIFQMKSTKRSS